jgi:fructose-bisphosphate aldolase class I
MSELIQRTHRLVDRRRGILALDTAPAALAARFQAAGVVPATSATDASLRMLLGTPDLAADVSGVILTPAALPQAVTMRGTGILVGVRADTGHGAIVGRGRVTSGLDGLHSRLGRWRDLGVGFAVWSVCTCLADDVCATSTLTTNSEAAARFAVTCQDLEIIPLVRVGTRMAQTSPDRRRMALAGALLSVIGHLEDAGVGLGTTVVTTTCDADPSHPGAAGPLLTLPRRLGGVALCPARPVQGGAGDTIAALSSALPPAPPWPVTFYLGREASRPALHAWRGHAAGVPAGQRALRSQMAAATAALFRGRHLYAVPTDRRSRVAPDVAHVPSVQ